MSHLIDSDVVANWLQGRKQTVQLLSSLGQDLSISLITYGETYEGIYSSENPRDSLRGFRGFLRIVTVLPLNRIVMRRFAQVRASLRGQGLLKGDMDMLIAATALTHGLTLVTRNIKHYQRIPRLAILHQ